MPTATEPPVVNDPPIAEEPAISPVGCITFSEPSTPWWVKADPLGYAPSGVIVEKDTSKCIADYCGYFSGADKAKIEVPYFTNQFYNYQEFTISFWYRRLDGGSQDEQGLLSMGECADGGPVDVTSDPSGCQATVTTLTGEATVAHAVCIISNHICHFLSHVLCSSQCHMRVIMY